MSVKSVKKKTVSKKQIATKKTVSKKTVSAKKEAASVKSKAVSGVKATSTVAKNAAEKKKVGAAKVKSSKETKSTDTAPVVAPKNISFGSGGKPSATKITEYLHETVGGSSALILLSGGLVSSVLAVLAHKALGVKAKIFLLDNGLMRQDESKKAFLLFKKLNITVNIINARKEFTNALKDQATPAGKREGIRDAFYGEVMQNLVKQARAKYIVNCVCAETVDTIGVTKLKSLFKRFNIKPERPFGCDVLEPLAAFKRETIIALAKELKLPATTYNATHFSMYALAGRVAGAIVPEKVEIVRRATDVVDAVMGNTSTSRTFPIVHQELFATNQAAGITEGYQIEIRSWENKAGKVVKPYKLAPKQLDAIIKKVVAEVPGVASITLNVSTQPPVAEETV